MSEIKQAFWREIKERCPGFEVTEDNKPLLESLSLYIKRDEKYNGSECNGKFTFSKGKLDLDKGILIQGTYGVGKTTILGALVDLTVINFGKDAGGNEIFGRPNKISCRDIEPSKLNGEKTHFDRGVWFFDDLGNERESEYAKKDSLKAMSTILERRHYGRWKTFVTTNLDFMGDNSDFRKAYGGRLESRIYSMFNLYVLGGKDYRR